MRKVQKDMSNKCTYVNPSASVCMQKPSYNAGLCLYANPYTILDYVCKPITQYWTMSVRKPVIQWWTLYANPSWWTMSVRKPILVDYVRKPILVDYVCTQTHPGGLCLYATPSYHSELCLYANPSHIAGLCLYADPSYHAGLCLYADS